MNVLSLFDGMSCGQQALNRAGFKIDKYFASEIDKHAITVTMANYPETIQLGSVVDVNGYDLPKIDLLIGGSPCQSFSFAGKKKGMTTKDEQQILTLEHYLELKNEGFEFEGQSYLFWEYMRLLTEVRTKNPNVFFLLENVLMTENWERVLTGAIGVHPIEINSARVSAQNRRRLYWTNIGLQPAGLFGDLESIIQQPKDKGILLKDILQDNPNAKYYLSDKAIDFYKKNNKKNIESGNGYRFEPTEGNRKSKVLKTTYDMDANYIFCEPISEKYYLSDKMLEYYEKNNEKNKAENLGYMFEPTEGNKKSFTITTKEGKLEYNNFIICHSGQSEVVEMDFRHDEGFRIHEDGKTGTLRARARNDESCGQLTQVNKRIRRLTPVECERLQTVPDNYTNHVSDTQRYRMLGNGWTVDVIAHIFNYLPNTLKK